ncbi:MAG: glycosyltransferase family 39 protein [Verrucomicrobiota bacterium JB023]|nr:glycosyltransferase family 39 protein [Verrucomicrobiota bacterium JB023]
MKSNATIIFLRVAFFVLILGLSWLHTQKIFRGLSAPEGMEQAQLAREIARGNGLQTKVLKPGEIRQMLNATNDSGRLADIAPNTYHAPLNPVILGAVFRVIGANDFDRYRMKTDESIYYLDRVVAGFSIICFLLAVGMTYLLTCRVFDAKIASATVVSMVLCELFWSISMSGLPQMLMLLFTTCGLYFSYRAIESAEEGQFGLVHAILAAVFFALLALTHWLAIWIVLGYAVMASFLMRPRGLSGIIALVCLAAVAILPVMVNVSVTGNPLGSAFFVLYEGLANSEEYAMRTMDEVSPNVRGLIMSVFRSVFTQMGGLFGFLGGIIAAPIFFLSLLHGFKRPAISNFRWLILVMWLCACFGMALFGLPEGAADSNQLHLLFAPIMAAYGFAMLSILWTRLDIGDRYPLLSQAHLIGAVFISAAPMLFDLPRQFMQDIASSPNYPPYAPSIVQRNITEAVDEDEIIATDQPWAVAWYADRRSLWLPFRMAELEGLETMSDEEETPITAVLTTPISNGTRPLYETSLFYGDYLSLMMDGWAMVASRSDSNPRIVSSRDRRMSRFYNRFPYQRSLLFRTAPMILYTSNRTGS